MSTLKSAFFLFAAGLLSPPGLAEPDSVRCAVRIPQPDERYAIQNNYAYQLLRMILSSTTEEFGVCSVAEGPQAPGKRVIQQLAANQDYDLAWMPVTKQSYNQLKVIPYPIDKGTLGWRVLLIRQDDQPRFSQVSSLDDLRKLRAGFHEFWADYPVYEHNFGQVTGFRDYQSMLSMLQYGRFDYVSRALHEARQDVTRANMQQHIAVEETLLLHYPNADMFFVHPDNTLLARRITLGFEALLSDGSFQQLFEQYYGEGMRSISLSDRRLIELENPQFPKEIVSVKPELWLHYAQGQLQ